MAKSGKAPKKKAKKKTAKSAKTLKASAKPKKVGKAKPKQESVRTAAPTRDTSTPTAKKSKAAKVKSPFTKKQLDHFREKLLDLRDRLLSNVTAMEAEALKASDQDFSVDHMADHGSDNFEQDFTLSLVENERKELVDIDQALERIEHRSYGICEGSGEPIGRARLEAIPYARHSIDYQRRLESGELDETEDEFEDAERDRAGEKP